MKTSVYLSQYRADMDEFGATSDVGVAFDKVDHKYGLAHDDLARAMFEAVVCPVNLSVDEKDLLRTAHAAGEIDDTYMNW